MASSEPRFVLGNSKVSLAEARRIVPEVSQPGCCVTRCVALVPPLRLPYPQARTPCGVSRDSGPRGSVSRMVSSWVAHSYF
jgi:hypothetical protein